jgi:hypothetical protein
VTQFSQIYLSFKKGLFFPSTLTIVNIFKFLRFFISTTDSLGFYDIKIEEVGDESSLTTSEGSQKDFIINL